MPPRLAPPKALPQAKPVKIRPEWQEYLDSLPPRYNIGSPRRPFTPEEDAFLLAAWPRDSKDRIAEKLGISRNTLRRRYRELTKT